MATQEKLIKNKEYIAKEFEKLLNIYRGKYILVCDENIVGSYDTYETAADAGIDSCGIESGFLIQLMTENEPVNFVAIARL